MKNKETVKLDKIFDATLLLTGKVGIAGLKMSSIAKEASLATGSIYINFNNKEELLNALFHKLQRESAPAITKQIAHLPINIQLYKMWSLAMKRLVENNNRIVFMEQFVVSPFMSESNKKIDTDFKNYLKSLIDVGKKEKIIKDADSDMLISLIIGYLRNFSTQVVSHHKGRLTDNMIDESFALCWDAIKV